MSDGWASVTIHPGRIEATGTSNPQIGHQVRMGNDVHFHITAEMARQWIETLTPIANEESN